MAKAGGNLLNTYVADYVVFDLETTGISPKTDEVVEISAVKVEHGKVTDEFSTLVNPKQRIPYGASRVNGITDDMVAEAPFFEQVLEDAGVYKCTKEGREAFGRFLRSVGFVG